MTNPTSPALAHLLYLLDEAFDGPDWHSLLTNLRSVTAEEWEWVPPGGQRSIRDLVQHVGASKFVYHDHAFGGGTLPLEDPLVMGAGVLDTIPTAIQWLREGQARLRESLALLDDEELLRPRRTHWGEWRETRWIAMVMLQHDLYHAGEINHIRALCRGDDL